MAPLGSIPRRRTKTMRDCVYHENTPALLGHRYCLACFDQDKVFVTTWLEVTDDGPRPMDGEITAKDLVEAERKAGSGVTVLGEMLGEYEASQDLVNRIRGMAPGDKEDVVRTAGQRGGSSAR